MDMGELIEGEMVGIYDGACAVSLTYGSLVFLGWVSFSRWEAECVSLLPVGAAVVQVSKRLKQVWEWGGRHLMYGLR